MQTLSKLVEPRSRFARILLASILFGVSAWAFAPYLKYRIAPSAFINAELLRVTAPIAGRLTQDLPRKGEFVAQPEKVTLIDSMAPDRRHLLDIERQYSTSKENAELARKQLDENAAIDVELDARIGAYRDGMIGRLRHEVEEAEAERNGCLAEISQRIDVGSRMKAL